MQIPAGQSSTRSYGISQVTRLKSLRTDTRPFSHFCSLSFPKGIASNMGCRRYKCMGSATLLETFLAMGRIRRITNRTNRRSCISLPTALTILCHGGTTGCRCRCSGRGSRSGGSLGACLQSCWRCGLRSRSDTATGRATADRRARVLERENTRTVWQLVVAGGRAWVASLVYKIRVRSAQSVLHLR
jgi:hypothetical protein